MPSERAVSLARRRSREAIAVISQNLPFCIPGMSFFTPILAVLKIPHRTFLAIFRHHSGKSLSAKHPSTPRGPVDSVPGLSFAYFAVKPSDRKERKGKPFSVQKRNLHPFKTVGPDRPLAGLCLSYAASSSGPRPEADSDCEFRAVRCLSKEQQLAGLPAGLLAVLRGSVCHQSTGRHPVEKGTGRTRTARSAARRSHPSAGPRDRRPPFSRFSRRPGDRIAE